MGITILAKVRKYANKYYLLYLPLDQHYLAWVIFLRISSVAGIQIRVYNDIVLKPKYRMMLT